MSLNRRDSMHRWLGEAPGRLLVKLETDLVDQALANLFGYHIVQVGRLGEINLLARSRVLHHALVAVDGDDAATAASQSVERGIPESLPTARARATELPIDSDSVDVLVMPHVLEFEPNPHEALREGMRVLVPEGHIVICGFNPWSCFGLWRRIRRRAEIGPWQGRFLSLDRIKDWLALLGFDVLEVQGCFARPPFSSDRLLRRLNRAPPAMFSRKALLSGVYVVVGRKRVTRLTPIRTRWRPRRRLAEVGLAGPTARDGVARNAQASD